MFGGSRTVSVPPTGPWPNWNSRHPKGVADGVGTHIQLAADGRKRLPLSIEEDRSFKALVSEQVEAAGYATAF